ncbi:MAG: UpxY family transcription antiterminator [Candidatus Neomarinimicrobiota bacterium]
MNPSHDKKQWFAFYTKSKHEKSVYNSLVKQGHEVYLPLLKKKKKWSDRKRWVEFPLFKSYVFVKIEAKNEIFVLKTPGIVKMIKFGGKLAPVLEDTIKSLKLIIDGGYNPKPTDYFIKGDPVIIKDGPLKGIKGEVVRIQNEKYFIIHIDSIRHTISLKITRAFLSKL